MRLDKDGKPKAQWNGTVRLVPEHLGDPLRWSRPRRIFVGSMTDVFHPSVERRWLDSIFAVMALANQHVFQMLTKRPEAACAYLSDRDTPQRVVLAMDAVRVDEAMRTVREEWRSVVGAPMYEVSNFGQVRRGGRTLALVQHNRGYCQVALSVDGKPRTVLVHRLVLEAFDRLPGADEEVAHQNGIRTDNRIANLRWASRLENMADASRHGSAGAWMKSQSMLSEEDVDNIRDARRRGRKLGEIASQFKIDKRQVSAITLGKTYKAAPLKWPLQNVWLGTSIEDQASADERIPHLIGCQAEILWVSQEPQIGEVRYRPGWLSREFDEATREVGYPDGPPPRRLSWVVIGGESGPAARPFDVSWAHSTIAQCREAGVSVFVKQLGARPVAPVSDPEASNYGERLPLQIADRKGGDPAEWPSELRVREYPR